MCYFGIMIYPDCTYLYFDDAGRLHACCAPVEGAERYVRDGGGLDAERVLRGLERLSGLSRRLMMIKLSERSKGVKNAER